MRKLSWLSAAVLVVGVSLGVSAQETKKAGDAKKEIAWAKNYQEAVETAKKSGKLIMVDFYTDWCGWCKVLDQKTYTDANVIKLADASFVSLKINAEKEGTAQAKRYGVTGFPTILFLDASKLPEVGSEGKGKAGDGEVVGKIVGFKDAGPFALDMTGIAKAAKEYPALAARVEKDASDLEAIGKFAVVLHQRGNAQKAAQTLDKGEKLDPKNSKGLLTRAYNAVADDYQEAGEFNKAVPLFRKAADTGGKDVDAISYALQSIAACYLSQQQFDKAIPELEAALRLSGISDDDRKQAEDMLKQVKQRVK